MNKKIVLYYLSNIMVMASLLMLIPIAVSLIYGEDFSNILAFLKSMALILLVFLYPSRKKPQGEIMFLKEGFVICSLTWFLMAFFCGLPFYFSGQINSLVDCFFETASGLTTTGSSILLEVEKLSNSMLFWRSFLHFIGGMGVLVLGLALMPETSSSTVQMMRAEVPGPQFGKLLPRIKDSARILYKIYLVMTIVLVLILCLAGMPLFDSILTAFSTAGTGGFAIKNESIAYYNSPLIEVILGIFMVVFGVNFNLYYMILIGHFNEARKNEELMNFLKIIGLATILIFINISGSYQNKLLALKDSFFNVSSIISTTGFGTNDFTKWPEFSKWILICLMAIGSCAGSTAGGLKVSRVTIIFKSIRNEITRTIRPNRTMTIEFDGKSLDKNAERGILNYFCLYFFIFFTLVLIISLDSFDLETNFSAVMTTFNNVGPGLGAVGPKSNFSNYSNLSKIALSIGMISGRLEIYPVLLLFSRETWQGKN